MYNAEQPAVRQSLQKQTANAERQTH